MAALCISWMTEEEREKRKEKECGRDALVRLERERERWIGEMYLRWGGLLWGTETTAHKIKQTHTLSSHGR